jgi:single-stranded DNA-binding protein
VVVDNFQFLEPKADGAQNGHAAPARQASRPSSAGGYDEGADNTPDDNIPF